MYSTGIVRKVDVLGRLTIPSDLRKKLNITSNDSLEIFIDEETISLRKYVPADIFTGNMDELIDYCGQKVSRQSIVEMANLAGIAVKK